MIPLIPALALALFSFLCSAFVLLRIVIPILPPHPLSRRVSPAEFGLPNFRTLSTSDQSHLWLACLDIVALVFFCWQVAEESRGGVTGHQISGSPLASVRLWIAMTLRQTCLLIVAGITVLHVRMGRSVSFGTKHWMLFGSVLLIFTTSTALAGILADADVASLFAGLLAYVTTIGTAYTAALGCLIVTLLTIKRNLALHADDMAWPPMRQTEETARRPSFATEDIDAIKDGASWLTSHPGSRPPSVSNWSFSTHHTRAQSQASNYASLPVKSTFWFSSSTPPEATVPPVPPLPAPYGPLSPTAGVLAEADPFRRESPTPGLDHPRNRLDSQASWLTSNGSQTTMSAWSFPTTRGGNHSIRSCSSPNLQTEFLPASGNSRPPTPALAEAQVLGGYGFRDGDKGSDSPPLHLNPAVEISGYRAIGWILMAWLPAALTYPYIIAAMHNSPVSSIYGILLTLSVTVSSPILALNLIFDSPFPIPSGLFDAPQKSSTSSVPQSTAVGSVPPSKWSHEYKQSTTASVTVIEGRRSGDVWIAKGDAVDGKSKLGRAVGMMSPMPKLSVLPPADDEDEEEPPVHNDSSLPVSIHNTPASEISAQFGRLRKDSKASSSYSVAEDSLAFATHIMVAQRHYSTLAKTMRVSTSPEKNGPHDMDTGVVASSGVTVTRASSGHLRSRSATSIEGNTGKREEFSLTPPPSFPLPPTPPSVRAHRLAKHKKSFSSGFSFSAVDDVNEIDALTAGVLPLLVPGLKVGSNMKIKDDSPPSGFADRRGKKPSNVKEFGGDFSSPEFHSTPARTRQGPKKTARQRRHHFSLPSLGLGKDGAHSFITEIGRALENQVGQYTALPSNADIIRRYTVFGCEATSSTNLLEVDSCPPAMLGRTLSTRDLGLRADVPHSIDVARTSVTSINAIPLSAASTVTLFEELEADLNMGPQAESTPHNSVANRRRGAETAPPMPLPKHVQDQRRRSSIVYIKSEDVETVTPPSNTSAMSSFAQWSSRAVRPLIPRSGKLQRKPSSSKPISPSGLRPLSLLKNQDQNVAVGITSKSVRPLLLGKKPSITTSRHSRVDENSPPNVGSMSSKNKNIKSLQLARSETTKSRGLLRMEEKLPNVIVRPPSHSEHQAYAYTFRE